MTETESTTRVRTGPWSRWAAAAAGGIVVALAHPHPTGGRLVDVVWALIAGALVVWAGASNPWWSLAVAAAPAFVVGSGSVPLVLSIVAFGFALAAGASGKTVGAFAPALSALCTVAALARLGNPYRFGISAAVGVGVGLFLVVVGRPWRHLPTGRRRIFKTVLVAAVGFGVVAAVGLGIGGYRAANQVNGGRANLRAALSAMTGGDAAGAKAAVADARSDLDSARSAMSAPWSQLSRVVPVLAQHQRAGREVFDAADTLARRTEDLVDQIDFDHLRLRHGSFDLAAVAGLGAPLDSLISEVDATTEALDRVRSPWLLGPVDDRLDSLSDELGERRYAASQAAAALKILPSMLGGDKPRTYFVGFTSPTEARGVGGFLADYAELHAENGTLSMTKFGTIHDLRDGGSDPDGRVLRGHDEFLARYGKFGFGGDGSKIQRDTWLEITIPADTPMSAEVIADLYPQSGGTPVDGVILLDPHTVAALLSFTGPVKIDGVDQALNAKNAADFLLKGQYELAVGQDERRDLLGDLAQVATKKLLSSDLPSPSAVAKKLGPLVQAQRLSVWSAHPDEQATLSQLGLTGELPSLNGRDGIAVTLNNGAGNKMDIYLDRQVEYVASVDPATGLTQAGLRVTVTNNAPEGLPDYVVGNGVGDPPYATRQLVSIYTALPVKSVTLNGQPGTANFGTERGWNVAPFFVGIPHGKSVIFTLQLEGTLDVSQGYGLTWKPQPLGRDATLVVDVHTTDGRSILAPGQRSSTNVGVFVQ